MDVNSISFQMFLLMLSFIILGLESQISVFKQCQSNTHMSDIFKREGSIRISQNLETFRSVQFLTSFH